MGDSWRSLWLPDREPTWAEVLSAISVIPLVVSSIAFGDPISLSHAAVGVVVALVALGPVAASPVGQKVGTWFRAIGKSGRAAVILIWAIGVFVAFGVLGSPPADVFHGLLIGFLSSLVGLTAVHVAVSGGVNGWRTD